MVPVISWLFTDIAEKVDVGIYDTSDAFLVTIFKSDARQLTRDKLIGSFFVCPCPRINQGDLWAANLLEYHMGVSKILANMPHTRRPGEYIVGEVVLDDHQADAD
jgi:hypothetical protein